MLFAGLVTRLAFFTRFFTDLRRSSARSAGVSRSGSGPSMKRYATIIVFRI
jgi:hypothetical protein